MEMKFKVRKLSEQEVSQIQGAEMLAEFKPQRVELHYIGIHRESKEILDEETNENITVEEKFARVDSHLYEENYNEDGSFKNRTVKISHHKYPFEIWEKAVIDINRETGEVILDPNMIKGIFYTFGLEIID